jgi:hypothetical protein
MKRRDAIKSLLIVTGGVIVIPSCLQRDAESTIQLKHIKIDGSQEKQLAELAETIIPATATPGAKDTYAHRFALKMVDDCHDKADQEKFMKGFKEVDNLSKQHFNTTFLKSTPAQREQLVGELEKRLAAPAADDNLAAFYKLYKGLVIQGYMGSKYVMGSVLKFELVPGRYNGASPVKQTNIKI